MLTHRAITGMWAQVFQPDTYYTYKIQNGDTDNGLALSNDHLF